MNKFYQKYYGKMPRGAFKMIGLVISVIFLASVFGLGENLDAKGLILNIILSHLIVITAGLIVNYLRPKLFEYKNNWELIIGFTVPLFMILFIFTTFSRR